MPRGSVSFKIQQKQKQGDENNVPEETKQTRSQSNIHGMDKDDMQKKLQNQISKQTLHKTNNTKVAILEIFSEDTGVYKTMAGKLINIFKKLDNWNTA